MRVLGCVFVFVCVTVGGVVRRRGRRRKEEQEEEEAARRARWDIMEDEMVVMVV